MFTLRVLAGVAGGVVVSYAGWSVIGTLIVPRRIHTPLIRAVAIGVRLLFRALAHRLVSYQGRDRILSFQAPVQLVAQIAVWLLAFELGFALLLWSVVHTGDFATALVEAGSSICTLGYAAPHTRSGAAIFDLAALSGLGTVALQIGYLPTLYAAFNRRETLVAMLESRAGLPSWGPELLARTHYGLGTGLSSLDELPELFEKWESWSADVAESHSTYSVLAAFRSPHPLASWLTAQLAVLDAAALYLSVLDKPKGTVPARLCLRGGFTCLNTVARAIGFHVPEDADPDDGISLSYEEFTEAIDRLRKVGFPLERSPEEAWPDFVGWRVNYEAAAYAIAYRMDAPPALWSGPRPKSEPAIAPMRPPTRTFSKARPRSPRTRSRRGA